MRGHALWEHRETKSSYSDHAIGRRNDKANPRIHLGVDTRGRPLPSIYGSSISIRIAQRLAHLRIRPCIVFCGRIWNLAYPIG